MPDDISDRFETGIKYFNEEKFYESHDVLEDVWFDIRGETRKFYQGLIHLAVGFHHMTVRHNPVGAESQLQKGIEKLSQYKPEYQGIELEELLTKVTECVKKISKCEKADIIKTDDIEIPKIRFDKKKFVIPL